MKPKKYEIYIPPFLFSHFFSSENTGQMIYRADVYPVADKKCNLISSILNPVLFTSMFTSLRSSSLFLLAYCSISWCVTATYR